MKSRIQELNASDERGIDVIRNKVKNFSSLAVAATDDYPCPPYKIVILDEADNMTGTFFHLPRSYSQLMHKMH